MQLSEYLKSSGIRASDFADRIGARSRSTVYRYMRPKHDSGQIPDIEMMARIVEATDGLVTANDFYGLPGNSKTNGHKSKPKRSP